MVVKEIKYMVCISANHFLVKYDALCTLFNNWYISEIGLIYGILNISFIILSTLMQKRLKKGLGDDYFSFILSMSCGRCHSFDLMWEVINWYRQWFSIKPHSLKATQFHMGVVLVVV